MYDVKLMCGGMTCSIRKLAPQQPFDGIITTSNIWGIHILYFPSLEHWLRQLSSHAIDSFIFH
jgi:hypothetical protein